MLDWRELQKWHGVDVLIFKWIVKDAPDMNEVEVRGLKAIGTHTQSFTQCPSATDPLTVRILVSYDVGQAFHLLLNFAEFLEDELEPAVAQSVRDIHFAIATLRRARSSSR